MSTILTFNHDPEAIYELDQYFDIVSNIENDLIRQIFAAVLGEWQGDLESDDWGEYTHYELVKKLSDEEMEALINIYSEITNLPISVIGLLSFYESTTIDNDNYQLDYTDDVVGVGFEDFINANLSKSIFKNDFSVSTTKSPFEDEPNAISVQIEGKFSLLFELIEEFNQDV